MRNAHWKFRAFVTKQQHQTCEFAIPTTLVHRDEICIPSIMERPSPVIASTLVVFFILCFRFVFISESTENEERYEGTEGRIKNWT